VRRLSLALATLAAATCAAANKDSLPLDKIRLPPGFRIGLYARVPHARSMALSPAGTLFVGTRESEVYAVRRGTAEQGGEVLTIAKGLKTPNGVAFRDGALYVAEISRILRYDDIDAHLASPGAPAVVRDDFPKDTHHGWKFIAFGPDGWLYVPVGAPCNICDPKPDYAAIHRMKPDGSAVELYASGIRNTVGFDWDPRTKDLWLTDNGRDWLGDDRPPDELDHAPKAGMHFGYPYCHGRDISDPEFGAKRPCSEFTPPERELAPHVAALGLRFYTGAMFPPEYRNQIFFAEHGSWNRSNKIGYRVSLVRLESGKAASYETFAEGWLQDGKVWGRPVDVQVMPDGALLVSDDYAGAIYRISH
jgi:glucose/arabinose dehydrogenase